MPFRQVKAKKWPAAAGHERYFAKQQIG